MKKIIALGGGEIGRPGFPVETTKIDREIIKLTGKRKPKLLFLPTASSDSELYVNVVKKHFGSFDGRDQLQHEYASLGKHQIIRKAVQESETLRCWSICI